MFYARQMTYFQNNTLFIEIIRQKLYRSYQQSLAYTMVRKILYAKKIPQLIKTAEIKVYTTSRKEFQMCPGKVFLMICQCYWFLFARFGCFYVVLKLEHDKFYFIVLC